MLNAQEAQTALQDVAAAGRRSREVYGYSMSAPYLFVWGIAWAVGYGWEAFARPYRGWVWAAVILVGVAACILISREQTRRNRQVGWRIGMLFIVIYAFTAALFAIMHPTNNFQIGAYFPLLFAAIYAGMGLWLGVRYIIVGAILAAATLGAYFFLREYFFLWMAIVGGGSLVLTGFWLRQA